VVAENRHPIADACPLPILRVPFEVSVEETCFYDGPFYGGDLRREQMHLMTECGKALSFDGLEVMTGLASDVSVG